MYDFIKGEVAEKGSNYAVLETAGVGYRIHTNFHTLAKLSGGQAKLYTYLHVREDEQTLYGFATQEERTMFQRLLAVSGVGPKVALSVLSAMTAGETAVAIIAGDAKAFSSVPGIGAKTAQRILLELREKIDSREALFTGGASSGTSDPPSEAVHALCALGYGRSEAAAAVSAVCKLADTAEELIVLALKRMGK